MLLLTLVQTVSAHGYIVRAIPENRAVLERAPTRLQYWFSESLERDFSSITLRDQNGEVIATGGVDEENNTLIRAQLPPNLPDGAYIIDLRPAFASDGHVVAESRVFFVGEEVGGVAGQSATDQAIPLEVLWRGLLLIASMLLFGAFTLYSMVLVPAWGNPEYRAGLLPPRVMNRLNWTVGLGLVVAFAANILALLQQAMTFFDASMIQVIEGGLWSVVRIGSRFGDVWNFRTLFLVIVTGLFAASLYYRKSQPETVRPFWIANAWMMALVVATFSVTSHAAGSIILPWVAVAVDWLHALAVGFWIGGIMALVLVLPVALKPYTGDTHREALLAVMRGFSPLAVGSVLMVISTGVYSALNYIFAPSDLTQTTFGTSLLLKLLMVGLLLLVAALHQIALNPQRYQAWQRFARRAGNFSGTLRLEVLFALAVLIGAGLLTATPVPVPEFTQNEVPAPTAAQTVGDLDISLTVIPGGPGVNTYDTAIQRDGQPVEDLSVSLRKIAPERDQRGEWQSAEPVDAGLYVGAGDEIDQPGNWWTLVDVTDSSGETVRAAFDWTITDEASVIASRPPGILNLLALAGVLGAIGFVVYPSARRFYERLDLSPVNLTIALGTTAATILFMVVGFVVVQDTQERYNASLEPEPEIVNPVLPDQDSLRRGEAIYLSACADWEDNAIDMARLRDRLHRTRDEELYTFTRDGWRDLPPCTGDFDATERWHLVNYIRTFERE